MKSIYIPKDVVINNICPYIEKIYYIKTLHLFFYEDTIKVIINPYIIKIYIKKNNKNYELLETLSYEKKEWNTYKILDTKRENSHYILIELYDNNYIFIYGKVIRFKSLYKLTNFMFFKDSILPFSYDIKENLYNFTYNIIYLKEKNDKFRYIFINMCVSVKRTNILNRNFDTDSSPRFGFNFIDIINSYELKYKEEEDKEHIRLIYELDNKCISYEDIKKIHNDFYKDIYKKIY